MYICELMNIREYRDHFLTKLNNFRSYGVLSMPENIYNYLVKIMLEILKYYIKEKQTDSGTEIIIDYNIIRYIFILSQTFFYMKDGKRVYLQNGLKNLQLFQDVELWKNLLQINIKEELENMAKKRNIKFDEKEYKEKGREICLMQILPYIGGFNGFGMKKEKIKEIADFFIREYNLNESEKEVIFQAYNGLIDN